MKQSDGDVMFTHILTLAIMLIGQLYIYSFVHELGHSLIGILCGGRIAKLKIGLGAYVNIEGAKYTRATQSIEIAFGTLLPLIFMSIALFFMIVSQTITIIALLMR